MFKKSNGKEIKNNLKPMGTIKEFKKEEIEYENISNKSD